MQRQISENASTSTALTITNLSHTPERSLSHQVVLEEDEYTAALSHIIARDFFPSLTHLNTANAYLDEHELSLQGLSHDTPHVRASSFAPTPTHSGPTATPSFTPSSISTPANTSVPKFDTSLSLDAFQARYTSEDNASFAHILNEENKTRRARWGWAWDAQGREEARHTRAIETRERRLIEAPSQMGVRERLSITRPADVKGLLEAAKEGDQEEKGSNETGEKTMDPGEDKSDNKDVALVEKHEDMEVDVMAPQNDTRAAGVDGWQFKARNSLMFPPDADVSPYALPKHMKREAPDPRSILHGNTRLQDQEPTGFSQSSRGMSAPPSPTRSRIDAAISGTPYRPRSPSQSDFSLVPNVPSPTPEELGPAAVKQLMTWGTLTATPRIISQGDGDGPPLTPGTPFHLQPVSAREAISHKLSSSAARSLRAKASLLGLKTGSGLGGTSRMSSQQRKKGDMMPPTWTPRRSEAAGNLTPAARRLLERTTMGSRRAEAMERQAAWDGGAKARDRELNRVRWTPTPSPVTRR